MGNQLDFYAWGEQAWDSTAWDGDIDNTSWTDIDVASGSTPWTDVDISAGNPAWTDEDGIDPSGGATQPI